MIPTEKPWRRPGPPWNRLEPEEGAADTLDAIRHALIGGRAAGKPSEPS